jgi:hypothetical protein
MISDYFRRLAVICCCVLLTAACGGPQVTRVQELADDSGAPFENILVVTLFAEYGARKTLEKRIVSLLAERGTKSVASTSMMDTKTPMTTEVYIAMVDKIGADAVLVTQLVSLDSEMKAVDASPETTVEVRPTYYFNVWNVNVTEYVEPQFLYDAGTANIATRMLSVAREDAVWAIESTIEFAREVGVPRDFVAHDVESELIVKNLARDGLIASK